MARAISCALLKVKPRLILFIGRRASGRWSFPRRTEGGRPRVSGRRRHRARHHPRHPRCREELRRRRHERRCYLPGMARLNSIPGEGKQGSVRCWCWQCRGAVRCCLTAVSNVTFFHGAVDRCFKYVRFSTVRLTAGSNVSVFEGAVNRFFNSHGF